MTPQEKAKELVEKFNDGSDTSYAFYYAKQCALIAIEEIKIAVKNSVKRKRTYIIPKIVSEQYKFFEEVKQEIEKL